MGCKNVACPSKPRKTHLLAGRGISLEICDVQKFGSPFKVYEQRAVFNLMTGLFRQRCGVLDATGSRDTLGGDESEAPLETKSLHTFFGYLLAIIEGSFKHETPVRINCCNVMIGAVLFLQATNTSVAVAVELTIVCNPVLLQNCQKHIRNPTTTTFQKMYRNTPPLCTAIRLQFVSQCLWCPYALRKKGNIVSSLPIRIAVHPPFVLQYASDFVSQFFWGILVVVVTRMFPKLDLLGI